MRQQLRREKLIERGCDVLMVQARGGQNFGRMTIDYLSRIHRALPAQWVDHSQQADVR